MPQPYLLEIKVDESRLLHGGKEHDEEDQECGDDAGAAEVVGLVVFADAEAFCEEGDEGNAEDEGKD